VHGDLVVRHGRGRPAAGLLRKRPLPLERRQGRPEPVVLRVLVRDALPDGGEELGVAAVEPPPATVTTARFTTLEGNVKVKTVGTFEWVNADRSMVLRKSDLVRTGAGAAAEITFFDGTTLHVRPDSLITIEESSEDPRTKQRRVAAHISSGEVQFNAPRSTAAGAEREFSTPTLRTTTGEAAAGGVSVQESGESNVKLYTGTATVATKTGDSVKLAANTQLKVDAAGKAEPVHALPQVPVELQPADAAQCIDVAGVHAAPSARSGTQRRSCGSAPAQKPWRHSRSASHGAPSSR